MASCCTPGLNDNRFASHLVSTLCWAWSPGFPVLRRDRALCAVAGALFGRCAVRPAGAACGVRAVRPSALVGVARGAHSGLGERLRAALRQLCIGIRLAAAAGGFLAAAGGPLTAATRRSVSACAAADRCSTGAIIIPASTLFCLASTKLVVHQFFPDDVIQPHDVSVSSLAWSV